MRIVCCVFHPSVWILSCDTFSFITIAHYLNARMCGDASMTAEGFKMKTSLENTPQEQLSEDVDREDDLHARELINFTAGSGAGYGQDKLPDIVLARQNREHPTAAQCMF